MEIACNKRHSKANESRLGNPRRENYGTIDRQIWIRQSHCISRTGEELFSHFNLLAEFSKGPSPAAPAEGWVVHRAVLAP